MLGWWLSLRWFHPIAQGPIEVLESLEARGGMLGDFGAPIVIDVMHCGAQKEDPRNGDHGVAESVVPPDAGRGTKEQDIVAP